MKNLLILTVGTGTAGKHSNLIAGLRRTIELLAPRKFWLVSSTSEDSLTTAELLSDDSPAFVENIPLDCPDDLEACRKHLRDVIAKIRPQLQKDEHLVINPTSGTKQMTAAATLAALDEGIGDIVFTTGERADGVVKTGTERIQTFDASVYFRERDIALAREFLRGGDFFAAERIFFRYKGTNSSDWSKAYTLHHWRRFDYEKAKTHKAELANRSDKDIIADVLGWAFFEYGHGNYDASYQLFCKALELAARQKLGAAARETLHENLKKLGADENLFRQKKVRNQTAHEIRPIGQQETAQFGNRVKNLLAQWLQIAPTREISNL